MKVLIPVAGEIKEVERDLLKTKEKEGAWGRCCFCEDYVALKGSRIAWKKKLKGEAVLKDRYKYDPDAWCLGMPVHEYKVFQDGKVYCSETCRDAWDKMLKALKRSNPSLWVRPMIAEFDFMPRGGAIEVIDRLDLLLDEECLKAERSDARHINIPETLVHKFQKGIWRVCQGPTCLEPNRIYYTEFRRWFELRDIESAVSNPSQSPKSPQSFEEQDGERLIQYLDISYVPEVRRRNRITCSPRCRKALSRVSAKDA